jgi:hypothetical protein
MSPRSSFESACVSAFERRATCTRAKRSGASSRRSATAVSMMRRTVAALTRSAFAICWWEKPETKRSKMASRRSKPFVRRFFAAARASSRCEGRASSR